MPSRAELRVPVEWALRGALVVALATALWRSVQPATASSLTRTVAASALGRELGGVVADPRVTTVDVAIDVMPTRADRDMLVASRRAGMLVRWHDLPPALAIEVVRGREPDARSRVLVVAEDSAALALADSAGLIDTVRATGGATIDVATIVGSVRVQQGAFSAVVLSDAKDLLLGVPGAGPSLRSGRQPSPGAVLVLGRADWEGKFVMSALDEAGWQVRASLPVAPGVAVRDDGVLPLDTSRYDVVVALDSSASAYGAAIARFVAEGGGLVASGEALDLESIRTLVPGRAGSRLPGRILLAGDSVRPRDLPLRPVTLTRADAMTLDRQPAGAALVARRAGMGRVLAVGYDESWRWRMLGGASGLPAHRAWWSGAAGSVARERVTAQPSGSDAAPLASLVSALGGPVAAAATRVQRDRDALPLLLLILIASCLLAETASRRFRGAT